MEVNTEGAVASCAEHTKGEYAKSVEAALEGVKGFSDRMSSCLHLLPQGWADSVVANNFHTGFTLAALILSSTKPEEFLKDLYSMRSDDESVVAANSADSKRSAANLRLQNFARVHIKPCQEMFRSRGKDVILAGIFDGICCHSVAKQDDLTAGAGVPRPKSLPTYFFHSDKAICNNMRHMKACMAYKGLFSNDAIAYSVVLVLKLAHAVAVGDPVISKEAKYAVNMVTKFLEQHGRPVNMRDFRIEALSVDWVNDAVGSFRPFDLSAVSPVAPPSRDEPEFADTSPTSPASTTV